VIPAKIAMKAGLKFIYPTVVDGNHGMDMGVHQLIAVLGEVFDETKCDNSSRLMNLSPIVGTTNRTQSMNC
jgi:hypothetical protein